MMKRIKNYAMALVALVIAATSVTLMSFKHENKKEVSSAATLTDQFWDFTGSPGDELNPQAYSPASENPSCDLGTEVCQIYAPSDADPVNPKPLFSATATNHGTETVEQRIENALTNLGNETVTKRN